MINITEMIHKIGHFFLSEWLWGLTWGLQHIPLNTVIMLLLVLFVARLRTIPSVLITLGAQLFSVFVFSLFVVIGIVWLGDTKYTIEIGHQSTKIEPLAACLYLGLIYAILQSLFMMLIYKKNYIIDIRLLSVISLLSNLLTALIIYRFLPPL